MPRNAKIHHNYFSGPTVPGNSGGAIRFGFGTGLVPVGTQCLVEYNLFERFNQEKEIIPAKQGGNVYRYNTFKDCNGELSLRSGGRQIVVSNYFINMKGQSIAAWGINNFIANNVFKSNTNYVIRLNPGVNAPGIPFYQQDDQNGCFSRYSCERLVTMNNTFIDLMDYNNDKIKGRLKSYGGGSLLGFDHYKSMTAERIDYYQKYSLLVANNYIIRKNVEDQEALDYYKSLGYYSTASGWSKNNIGPKKEILESSQASLMNNIIPFGFLLQSMPHPAVLRSYYFLDDNTTPLQHNGYPLYSGSPKGGSISWDSSVPVIPGMGFDTVEFVKNELTTDNKITIGSNLPEKMEPLKYQDIGPAWLVENPSSYGATGEYSREYYDIFKQWAIANNYKGKSILKDSKLILN